MQFNKQLLTMWRKSIGIAIQLPFFKRWSPANNFVTLATVLKILIIIMVRNAFSH